MRLKAIRLLQEAYATLCAEYAQVEHPADEIDLMDAIDLTSKACRKLGAEPDDAAAGRED